MPIHDLGYRPWRGRELSGLGRWWVIAETGIRLAWKSHWLRRMLLVAWVPAVFMGVALFLYESSVTDQTALQLANPMLAWLPDSKPILDALADDPAAARHEVWSFILLSLFRYPQGFLMVLLVGLIAPSLIARDMRTRAYLLYFSRPLDRADYVFGKSVIVWVYLALITTAPAVALYVLGVFLSPDLSVVFDTWDLPLRIVGASIWLIVPTTALALCFSSLTTESRYATFAWFSVWVLGWVAYGYLHLPDPSRNWGRGRRRSRLQTPSLDGRWTLVSLYHCLGSVQSWVFGLETDSRQVVPSIALLLALTLFSLLILLRRVSAPLRM